MNSTQKFQNLLKDLFQFEASDLDFGIYRILNYKRDQIERFITEDLKDKVEETFAKYKDERTKDIDEKFQKAKQKVIESLGKNAFTPTGSLKEEYQQTPIGKDYLSIEARKEEAGEIDKIKLQVFNDLYDFFSRYFEEGDFVPKYRYSIKSHKYAIPYNGEEVKLYWANTDQYYTKTGLLFRDYSFFTDSAKTYKVVFRIVSAAEELGSNRATKARFFILDNEVPVEKQGKTLVIRFQYRELTGEEVAKYDVAGGSNTTRQEKINQQSFERLLGQIEDKTLVGFFGKEYKNEKSLLLYQLSRFTAKNTKDYFIHKNLKSFLSNQLDYFIKAEVLSVETLEKERFLDKHITRIKVVREIGEKIIDFLAQIEDFQKKLWEKKKFVLKTDYVITLDRVPKEFHQEIFKNKAQVKEWKELGMLQTQNSKLPVDTKYFNQEFKEKLLEKLTEKADLDDLLDGLLIKSENWQALNLLLAKYKEQVQTIYIDPPFNTGEDFPYKDRYQNSSWVSLLFNRLELGKNFLHYKGSIFVQLDWNANYLGRLLLGKLFPICSEVIWNTNATKDEEAGLFSYKSFGDKFVRQHDTIFHCSLNENFKFIKLWKPNRNLTKLNTGWLDLISCPKNENPQKIQDYSFYVERRKDDNLVLEKIDIAEKIFPVGDVWNDIYSFMQSELRTSESLGFKTQKPENLLRRVIQSTMEKNDLILDFFAGSGTTASVSHKLKRKYIAIEMGDYFNEFWFDRDEKKLGLLGRIKIVLAGDKEFIAVDKKRHSHLSKDINWQGGGFFKYQVLEQYEDALDNIELKPNDQAQKLFKDDYLLKYFLDFETRGNQSLLNLEHLKNPFSYKIKVNLEEVGEPQEDLVDILETFNYLLGLKVKRVKVRKNKGKKYLFILGEKERKNTAIVWRDYQDNWSKDNFKKDKEFITQELEKWGPHIVYINGQSVLTTKLGKYTTELRYIEPEFKTLMFS